MFEIEELIEPIDETQPAGRDLRLDPADLTFQTLKDYTTVVDAALAESEGDAREANWSGVESLCVSALREKSKDLELAAALAQAWSRTEGLPGARQGLELFRRLLDRYWDSLHPGVDPDDGEISLPLRARWLGWLDSPNGFIRAIKQGPMLAGPGGTAFSWQDHENSALLDDATLSPERHDELVEAGVISPGQWTSALGSMGPTRLGELAQAVAGALETTQALAELCARHFDEDAPDFYNLRNALEEIHDYLAPHAGASTDAAAPAGTATAGPAAAAAAATPTAAGPIASREQALRALQDVGDFFRRTEPHSPISYLIARAVRWGSMPLDQLLKDVVRNDDVIDHIWETLGLDGARGGGADDED